MKEAQDSLSREDEQMPPANTIPLVTAIKVRIRPGQGEQLEHKLQEICREQKHLVSGTMARYIMHNQKIPRRFRSCLSGTAR